MRFSGRLQPSFMFFACFVRTTQRSIPSEEPKTAGKNARGASARWSDFAENGVQALDKLDRQHFDLVLLDIQMPEMDGYQVLERIIQDKVLCYVPVIMTTAMEELDKFEGGHILKHSLSPEVYAKLSEAVED